MTLTPKELRRYDRHIILENIGIKGQEKLKSAKVLVVGAGGLGTPVLQYLSAAGVGTIGIVDKDLVEESNLQRQTIYTDKDVGKLKTVTTRNKIREQNKNVTVNIYNIYVTKKTALKILSDYDIIVDCTDNIEARYVINDACIILNKPWVYGSVYKFEGQVSVFNYKKQATYRCLYPEQEKKVPKASTVGIFGVLPGIIGTIQASEVIKIITGIGEVLSGKVLVYNLLKHSIHKYQLKREEKNFEIDELIDYEEYCKPSI